MWDISRVIPVCALTGEVAGVAAALAAATDKKMGDISLLEIRSRIGYRERNI
jgi:hypothetical protein